MRIHGGDIKAIPGGIDFSSNLNPFAPSEGVKRILSKPSLEWFTTHPCPYPKHLEEKLAETIGVDPEGIVILPGSIYGIHASFELFKPQRVLIPRPTFNEYERVARALKITVCFHILKSENSFRLCLGELASAMEDNDLVFVCNPNNPTGYFFGTEEMEGLLRWCEINQSKVVFDEAFIDFTPHSKTTAQIAQSNRNCIVIRSLTKTFSIPGIRIGYALTHPETARRLRELIPSWSITNLACKVLEAAIEDWENIPKWRELINKEKSRLIQELSDLSLDPVPSAANYLLVRIPGQSAENIKEAMINRGILIRTFPEYPELDEFFRISIRRPEDNDRLIKSLKEVL